MQQNKRSAPSTRVDLFAKRQALARALQQESHTSTTSTLARALQQESHTSTTSGRASTSTTSARTSTSATTSNPSDELEDYSNLPPALDTMSVSSMVHTPQVTSTGMTATSALSNLIRNSGLSTVQQTILRRFATQDSVLRDMEIMIRLLRIEETQAQILRVQQNNFTIDDTLQVKKISLSNFSIATVNNQTPQRITSSILRGVICRMAMLVPTSPIQKH
jgi:hypothetical protein